MDHTRSAWGRNSIMTAALLSLSVVSQAAPVNTIFAAENSLYGRGYDIGRADGWMDDNLHQAISRFQSRTKGLNNTGNLDPATLKALSVDAEVGTISGNALTSQSAAMAALELKSIPALTTTPAATPVLAKAEAESAPEPAPAPVDSQTAPPEPKPVAVVRSQRPEPEPTETAETTATAAEPEAPAPTSQPKPKPAKSTTVALVKPTHTQPTPSQNSPEPGSKPAMHVTQAATETQAAATDDIPKLAATEAPADMAADNTARTDESTSAAAGKVATAGIAPASTEAEAANGNVSQSSKETTSSSGGFFSWLFDLLFGWMA